MKIGLVLGAGGITGFGYHSGALSALGQLTGWDPRTADIIVGTSAGAGFGAVLRGGVPIDEVLAHLLAAPSNPQTMARLRILSGREVTTTGNLWFGPQAPGLALKEMARACSLRPSRLGVALLPSGRIPTEVVGDRPRELHELEWPTDPLWICAMSLATGRRVVFGQPDGGPEIDVGTAVEASSAIPGFFRPVTVDGVAHVDGAVHSATNADLLAERTLDLVVICSPMLASYRDAATSLDSVLRLRSAVQLSREVKLLERHGHEVLVLHPGRPELRAMGPIPMDPTRMVPTVLQTSSSTIERLADPEYGPALAMLRRAGDAEVPPVVSYPGQGSATGIA